jgi:hypothetical protein
MIGNAVPVNFAQHLAKQIYIDLANTEPVNKKTIRAGKVVDVGSYLKLDQVDKDEVMAELC